MEEPEKIDALKEALDFAKAAVASGNLAVIGIENYIIDVYPEIVKVCNDYNRKTI